MPALPASEREPSDVVARGYDELAERYASWRAVGDGDPTSRYLEVLAGLLPAGAEVLELGCGPGEPTTRFLAKRFAGAAPDISSVQWILGRR